MQPPQFTFERYRLVALWSSGYAWRTMERSGAKKQGSRRDDARPDVLAVLRAVHEGGAAGIDPLGLTLDPERHGAAVLLATYRGWLTVDSKPPYLISITASGLALLKEKGMANETVEEGH